MTKTKKGFTLIELVIVVLVLAIIAAIGIPVVIGAVNNAKETKIKADINAIVTAVDTVITLREDYMNLKDRVRIPGVGSQENDGVYLEIENSVLAAVGDKLNGLFMAEVNFDSSPATSTAPEVRRYDLHVYYNDKGLGINDSENGYTYFAGEITKGITHVEDTTP